MKNLMKKFITGAILVGTFLTINPTISGKSVSDLEIKTQRQEYFTKIQIVEIEKIIPKKEKSKVSLEWKSQFSDKVFVSHTVVIGDTLNEIGRPYRVTGKEILNANKNCGGEYNLKVGYELKIPISIKNNLLGFTLPKGEKEIKYNQWLISNQDIKGVKKFIKHFGTDLNIYLGTKKGVIDHNPEVFGKRFLELKDEFVKASIKNGVKLETLAGACMDESMFDKVASSRAGARGLCGQLDEVSQNEHFLSELGIKIKPWNSYSNESIYKAAMFIKNYTKLYDSEGLGITAYNAGMGDMRKALKRTLKNSLGNSLTKEDYIRIEKMMTKDLVKRLREIYSDEKIYTKKVESNLEATESKEYSSRVYARANKLKEMNLI